MMFDLSAGDTNELKAWYRFAKQMNSQSTILSGYYDTKRLDHYMEIGLITWHYGEVGTSDYPVTKIIVITFTEDGLQFVENLLSFMEL